VRGYLPQSIDFAGCEFTTITSTNPLLITATSTVSNLTGTGGTTTGPVNENNMAPSDVRGVVYGVIFTTNDATVEQYVVLTDTHSATISTVAPQIRLYKDLTPANGIIIFPAPVKFTKGICAGFGPAAAAVGTKSRATVIWRYLTK
jgi:hypothetical protein